jgi:hypothetical protein
MLPISRTKVACVEEESPTQPPSFVRWTLRGEVLVRRLPVRGFSFRVSRQFAICGSSTAKSGKRSREPHPNHWVARNGGMLPHAIRLAALVPILAGLAGALSGAGFLGEPAGPATGSHLRYLSGLLLGLGLCAAWAAGDLRQRGAVFEAVCAVVVLGGLARFAGLFAEVPPWPHRLALVMELVVVPALWLWWQAEHALAGPRAGE